MRGPKPAVLALNAREQRALEELVRRHSTPQQIAQPGRMVLAAAQGKNNGHIARELGVKADTVRCWRMRWIGLQAVSPDDLNVYERLQDIPRPGRPAQITAEQTCQVMALACEQPKQRPISRLPGAGDRRRSDGTRHHQADLPTTGSSPLKKGLSSRM